MALPERIVNLLDFVLAEPKARLVAPLREDVISEARHLGDLYAESGQALQGSFSAVSKRASKYVQSLPEKRLRNPRATKVRLTLCYQYFAYNITRVI